MTLLPHVYATVDHMAKLTGQSRGAICAEFIEAVHEPFARTVAMLEAAMDGPAEVQMGLRNIAEGIERELATALGRTNEQIDAVLHRAPGSASPRRKRGGRARRSPAAKKAVDPRPCNTGVRNPKSAKSGK